MLIQGMTLHYKCGGLGIVEDKNGDYEVCKECMGTGMIEVESDVNVPEIYIVRC
jgi:DnaJ-class molecular chaperone